MHDTDFLLVLHKYIFIFIFSTIWVFPFVFIHRVYGDRSIEYIYCRPVVFWTKYCNIKSHQMFGINAQQQWRYVSKLNQNAVLEGLRMNNLVVSPGFTEHFWKEIKSTKLEILYVIVSTLLFLFFLHACSQIIPFFVALLLCFTFVSIRIHCLIIYLF